MNIYVRYKRIYIHIYLFIEAISLQYIQEHYHPLIKEIMFG